MDLVNFLQDQILFYISIILVLFLPGYFLLLAVFGKKYFSSLEKFVISFGLSIASVNFLVILLVKAGFSITRTSIVITILLFSIICWVIKNNFKFRIFNFKSNINDRISNDKKGINNSKLNNSEFNQNSKLLPHRQAGKIQNSTILIILLLFLTVFIKTAYLKDSVFPTSTDLGHHMYWSKVISETGQLPVYEKNEIIEVKENYQISDPQPIADFIIGEHLIFSAINLISGISFVSYFPSLILFLINIMGILAVFILVLRLFENNRIFARNTATLTLLLLGPLYAIASPQAKFISGGVIGNVLGNLFIPLSLYFYLRALKEKNPWFLSAALFLTAVIFYSHHLSAFIFMFIFAFAFTVFFVFNIKNIARYFKSWMKLILTAPVIFCGLLVLIFGLWIYTPAYIQSSAVETAVGGPSKTTRAGLTFSQMKFSSGEIRMALGILGLVLLAISRRRKSYAHSIALGWLAALLVMSLKPQWLYLDIPSGRIANYISFPLAISGAFALAWLFFSAKNLKKRKYYISSNYLFTAYGLLITSLFIGGFYDNSLSLSEGSDTEKAMQTFRVSEYLSENVSDEDIVLKDHNYITADTWMKLYFMRDYYYPFSRSYFKRYEDTTKEREQCTLKMISAPASAEGEKCYVGTGINFIAINPEFDSTQFKKSEKFWKVYSGNEIAVYFRPVN